MKICVIGPTYPFRGGISHYTTLLTQALRSDSEENEVLLISFTRQYPQWLFPGKSDKDPSAQPLTTSAEYLIDSINPFSWLRTLRRIRQFAPDVVVMQWWVSFWTLPWFVLGWGSRMMGFRPKIKFIVHNAQPHEASIIDRLAIKLGLSAAHILITQSKADQSTLSKLFRTKQIAVTPHPTYASIGDEANSTIQLPHPAHKPLLLFCGFIRPYKGLDILLDAMPGVLKQIDLHLAIVGEMWQGGAQYAEQIERLALSQHVTVENDYVSNERLGAWVRSADAVVLPYRSATQSGIIQLAFGQSVPVITTRVGGLPDVVSHRETGLLVEPDNVDELQTAIIDYFKQELKPQLQRGIKATQSKFDWHVLVDLIQAQ